MGIYVARGIYNYMIYANGAYLWWHMQLVTLWWSLFNKSWKK